MTKNSLTIHSGILHLPGGKSFRGWMRVEQGRIAEIREGEFSGAYPGEKTIDAGGCHVLPGMVDTHVHFREPGLTHKATIASESRAAVLGGVTSFLDMPNTKPATTTLADLRAKKDIAARTSLANYGFFLGATADNMAELRASASDDEAPGVKLFIGSSTGNMAVGSDEALDRVFEAAPGIVMVHAEDDALISANAARAREKYAPGEVPVAEHPAIRSAEACLAATKRAVDFARRHGKPLHIAHITSAAELEYLAAEVSADTHVTAEATALHLIFAAPDDYTLAGPRIKVNPAVKTADDREALRSALRSGLIRTIGTDHAPHLLTEKQGGALSAASGAPSIQFALPLLLGIFGPDLMAEKYAYNPASLFGIPGRGSLAEGNWADITIVRECEPYLISDSMVASPCGWTPFAGQEARWEVCHTIVNGHQVVADGKINDDATAGMPLKFDK